MLAGEGARRVRDLFAAAKKRSPCIVFIDEIDTFGGRRDSKDLKRSQTLWIKHLFDLDILTVTLVVPSPDVEGRKQIMESHMSKALKGGDVDLTVIAKGTPGFSGADLANIVNVAALKAAKDGAKAVSMTDIEYANVRIIMGSECKSAVITVSRKQMLAFINVCMVGNLYLE